MEPGMKGLQNLWEKKGVAATLLAALTLLFLLQCWRPYFFLTDDSFTLAFPVWVSVGQKIWSGQNPFISPELFGGDYPLYRDSQMIVLWHPVSLLLSLLSPTFLRNTLVDILGSANILLAVAGFRWLLSRWKDAGLTGIREGQAVFLSLSYGFSMYCLLLGSSGFWYLANVAALPWLVGAWWEKDRRRLLWIVIPAAFHTAVGGYPSCFIYSMMLVLGIGLWKARLEKNARLLLPYFLALAVAGLLSLPMMAPSLISLAGSTRGESIPVELASEHRMPIPVLLASSFLGSGSMLFGRFELFGKVLHAYGLASFAAGGLALASFWRNKKTWARWDFCLLVLMLLVALLVSRPEWLGEALHHVPVLGSLRWPHKEVFLMVFLLHLWTARGSAMPLKVQNLAAFAGALVFLASLTLAGPPSLNEHSSSRRLFISGQADQYWSGIKDKLNPGEQIIPVMPDELLGDVRHYLELPLILSGGGNFPAMYDVKSWSGYSATMPSEIFYREPHPANVVGIFSTGDRDKLSQLPGAVFLEMDKGKGVRILMRKKGQEPFLLWGE